MAITMAQHRHTHRYHHPGLAAHADTAPGRAPGQPPQHVRALWGHRRMTHDTPNTTHAPAIVTVVSVGLDATAPLNACSPTSVTPGSPVANSNHDELRRGTTTPAHYHHSGLAAHVWTQPHRGLRDNHAHTPEHSGDIGA